MIRLEGLGMAAACVVAAACSGAPSRPSVPVSAAPAQGNPFDGADFYVDPAYAAEIEATIPAAPERAAQLRKLESLPTAIWLDSIAAVGGVARTLDDALARQKKAGRPVVTVLVVYDLPERDCAASASSGELALEAGGEARYAAEFIDPLAAQLRAHASQRVVIVVEPDSLANIATNTSIAKCAAADGVYRRSIALAVNRLSMPNVWLYLDAAHAAWLGWARNRAKIAQIYRDVLSLAGGADKIRGFATNVSNYDTLRGGDIARLEPSDPCPDELTYVEKLGASLAEVGIVGKGFLVDTSRNGRAGIKSKSASWCNVAGAGLGERPQSSPVPGVDAYWWIKPPGDSDGGSDPAAPGYDPNCGADSPDSLRGAPRAGHWFPAQLLQLVDNATPPVQ
jgi:cellulose 1,4-beta-cellobiosidase